MPVGAAPVRCGLRYGGLCWADSDNLRIVLTQDSWLSVKDAAGRTLVSAVRKQGEILSPALPPLPLMLVMPQGCHVYQRQIVDLAPHTKGAVATLSVAR
jgi:hypothetical protein